MATRHENSKTRLQILAEEDPDIAHMLAEPVGTPIKLSREQAAAVVEAGIGADPSLGSGRDFVRRVRSIWGGLLARG